VALRPVLERAEPLLLEAASSEDVLLADRIAREMSVELVALASGTEAEIAPLIAKTGRTLVYPARFPDKPKVDDPDEALDVTLEQMRRYLEAPAAPKVLREAGIPLALTARGLKNTADFPGNLRKMLDAGLTEDDALAALTTVPAKLLGVDRSMGTLEPGKIANVLVADGALFGRRRSSSACSWTAPTTRSRRRRSPRGSERGRGPARHLVGRDRLRRHDRAAHVDHRGEQGRLHGDRRDALGNRVLREGGARREPAHGHLPLHGGARLLRGDGDRHRRRVRRDRGDGLAQRDLDGHRTSGPSGGGR
jgi:hypothetical protein